MPPIACTSQIWEVFVLPLIFQFGLGVLCVYHSGRAHVQNTSREEFQEASQVDPFRRLSSAASGSLKAQREIAAGVMQLSRRGHEDGSEVEKTLIEGVVFARLAAAQGSCADQVMVISMLLLLARKCGSNFMPRKWQKHSAEFCCLQNAKIQMLPRSLRSWS